MRPRSLLLRSVCSVCLVRKVRNAPGSEHQDLEIVGNKEIPVKIRRSFLGVDKEMPVPGGSVFICQQKACVVIIGDNSVSRSEHCQFHIHSVSEAETVIYQNDMDSAGVL